MAYNASYGIAEPVWKDMSLAVQAAATRCATARLELKMKCPMLTHDGTSMTAAQAREYNVKVLHTDESAAVQLGVFDIPAIDGAICKGPKGEF